VLPLQLLAWVMRAVVFQYIGLSFYAQTVVDLAQAQTALAADREKLNRLLGLWGNNTRWQLPQS